MNNGRTDQKGAQIEEEAWASYKETAVRYPNRIVMLMTAHARSDRSTSPKVRPLKAQFGSAGLQINSGERV
jgi:hypothetical protein